MSTISPRNRSARAAALGNPASARMESGVGNCFPGLEMDVRVLEGRFFPGLLFWVVTEPLAPVPEAIPNQAGIRLKYLDYEADPMLPERSDEPWVQTLLATYSGAIGRALAHGRWYLHWLEQGGTRISCYQSTGEPYDGELLWRFVRCLAPDQPLKIALVQRDAPAPQPVVELTGFRRRYTGSTGVIDSSYPPGELTESMCNPWQHDFRDCACYYWASNHPDVVLGEGGGKTNADGDPSGPTLAVTWLDWLRRDRSPAGSVGAPASRAAAREAQLDHFEINRRWQELSFVIGGREVGNTYQPAPKETAHPYASTQEMIERLVNHLAPLEMTLAYQYLYGLFSLRDPSEAPPDRWKTMPADLVTARQFVTMVAVSEMTHLRWVNQLLWELDRAGLYPAGSHYEPVLSPLVVPTPVSGRSLPVLLPLDIDTLKWYEAIESPGALLDRAYARVVKTLEDSSQYPRHLYELAVRIDTDGMHHYERFRDIRRTFQGYDNGSGAALPYLRPVQVGSAAQTKAAMNALDGLVQSLREAYAAEAKQQFSQAQQGIDASRRAMDVFRVEAEALARQGIGVPFFGAP
jgi:Ferritin-like